MYDIVIIGGGIAGVSAAARLSSFASVVVLEQEQHLAYHASGRSAASFIIDYGNLTTRILNQSSLEYLKKDSCVLSDRGLMVLSKKSDKIEFINSCKSLGLVQISVSDAFKKLPIINESMVSYTGYRDDVYDLDTSKLIDKFVREAKKNGCKFIRMEKVEKISFRNRVWTINTQKNQYRSSLLVNAAGPWVDTICKLAGIGPLGLKAFRRSMARIPAPNSYPVASWPFISGPKEDWYAKPDAGQLIISPSEEVLTDPHDAWADDLTLAEGIARYQEMVTTPVTKMTSNWAGLRTFSPDRSLVIGPSVDNSSFFFMAGQGGYGFQTAPAASNLLKDLIIGQTSELDQKIISNLLPNRF